MLSAWLVELRQRFALSAPGSHAFRLRIGTYTTGSPALRSLNYTTSFLESPPYRWQTVGLLSLHNHISQYLTRNLSFSLLLSLTNTTLLRKNK